jgi:hypothetical protein
VFGTPFASEQRRRILWIENHLHHNNFYPNSFHTDVDNKRLQTYVQAEMTKLGTYTCQSEELTNAYTEFILAAQRLDTRDRVRNILQ